MKKTMNITSYEEDLQRFANRADLQAFFRGFGMDGLEVLEIGTDAGGILQPADVLGVHLRYYSAWMDFWQGDDARLLEEFGDRQTWQRVFGGDDRQALELAYRKNIRFANSLKPEYLVFHVSDCTMAESMLRRYHYTDAQVCTAAAQLLNRVTDEIDGQPWLLLENLWHPGLTLERPAVTEQLLEQVRYPKTGVMLDIGHLLHTNMELRTEDEAVDYVHSILDRYADLSFIKGVHLHQSLSGAYARQLQQTWQPAPGDYETRMWAIMTHIFQIDSHRPFQSPRIREILVRLPDLEYLCLEQISGSRQEHAGYLAQQTDALQGL